MGQENCSDAKIMELDTHTHAHTHANIHRHMQQRWPGTHWHMLPQILIHTIDLLHN